MNKDLTLFDKYTLKENNVTKSFIDLLRFSDITLTKQLVREYFEINYDDLVESKRAYGIQIGDRLTQSIGLGYVIGITSKNNNNRYRVIKNYIQKDSIPDAMIRLNNVVILIEVKVDGNKIDYQQMTDHEKKFADSEVIASHKFFYWEDIHKYLLMKRELFKYDRLTSFLIEQFTSYLENVGLSEKQTEGFILSHFINQPDVLKIVEQIRSYMSKLPNVAPFSNSKKSFGYVLIKPDELQTRKFFTLSSEGLIVLHMLNKSQAEEQQQKVNSVFIGNKKKYTQSTKEKETQINLNLISRFEDLRPFIDMVYQERRKKHYKDNNFL
ncbi:hypothetical protein [Paenibacillus odorifer]|uniref:Restriction endonuclease n=1 Tax=Paenibacillus odorifer TaxID=189426 RepID=A0A1R0WSM8_9BACL|nr:hypothetical protein [Paenibacillus odorifer]OMD20359.1 hypothetical protein BJP51_09760 [Paenibacillus odorifer]OMD58164.1 hypothetical protein BSK48_30670 [Paenibacillus odorifer]